jgi:polysaccharide pyruvyl transferase WcaK-like protein
LEGGAGSRLNPRVVTAEHEEENERWASRLREVICGWVENTGKMVLLAPEVDKEIASARRYLLEKLPQQVLEQVVLRDRFWNVDEAASVYARAAALVSMEPHSCIIGLANGVPSIHYYSPKHGQKAGMFADVGLPEWLHDIEAVSADTVVEALKRIDSDRAGALSRVAEAMAVVNGRSAEMMGAIDKCLHAGSCGYVG